MPLTKVLDYDSNVLYNMNVGSYSCCKNKTSESNQIVALSPLLKLIAEENRLKILCLLRQGEHCVCEIIEHLNLSQSLISHHLKDLKEAELISDEKRSQWVYYKLTEMGRKVTDLIFQI